MRSELRRISADEEPELAIANLSGPELPFNALCNRLCRVEKWHIPEHFTEGCQCERIMCTGEDEGAIFLHVVWRKCGRNTAFLICCRHTEFNCACELRDGERINRDVQHLKRALIQLGANCRWCGRKQDGLPEISKITHRRSDHFYKVLLRETECVKERDGE